MREISPDVLQLIKATLKKCDEVFRDHHNLWYIFDDARLSLWQEHLPEASNRGQRIESTVHYLQSKENTKEENALVLFLQVLSERYDVLDERKSLLLNLIDQLEPASMPLEEEPGVLIEANPGQEPMNAVDETDDIRRCALSVAFIEVPRYRRGENVSTETGTCWLIAPGLVMTCWHVVAAIAYADEPPPTPGELQEQIKHTLISFNYRESDKKRRIQYSVESLEYPTSDAHRLDFALLRLNNRDDFSFEKIDTLPLELDVPFTRYNTITIIQHPQGKKQYYTHGRFVRHSNTTGNILYTAPTERGTSGAPVLNRYTWRVIALHNGENSEAQLREGARLKYIMSELEERRPDLHSEIVRAQTDLSNALPSVPLTNPLAFYTPPLDMKLQSSFSPGTRKEQKTIFPVLEPTVPPAHSYEYTYLRMCCTSSALSCLAFHPSGRYLAAGVDRGALHILNTLAKDAGYTLKTYMNEVTSLAFNSDGKYLVLGDNDGTIALWDSSQQKSIRSFQGHSDWISSLAFSSKGQHLVSGSADGSIKVWEARFGTLVYPWRDQAGIFRVALHPQDEIMASAALGQSLRLHSLPQREIWPFPGKLSGVCSLLFSPDGRYLVAGDEQGVATVFETTAWKVVHRLISSGRKIRCLAFSPDSRLLASGGDDQVIQLWDVVRGKNIQTLVKHTGRIESLAFSPDGQYIASGGKDANIILWKRL